MARSGRWRALRSRLAQVTMGLLAGCGCLAILAGAHAEPPRTAPGAAASGSESAEGLSSQGVFFDDAFAEALRGSPPVTTTLAPSPTTASSPTSAPSPTASWSRVVTAEVLEDEIKRFIAAWSRASDLSRGAGVPVERQRRYLQHLTLSFLVLSEFDGAVRWQEDAGRIARDLRDTLDGLAREDGGGADERASAHQSQVRRPDAVLTLLQDLVRGGTWPRESEVRDGRAAWDGIIDRRTVMQRLDSAVKTVLAPASADGRVLATRAELVRHEAQIVQWLASILTHASAEDQADADYQNFCRQMAAAAEEFRQRAELREAEALGDSLRALRRACDMCHQAYRG